MDETTTIEVRNTAEGKKLFKVVEREVDLSEIKQKIEENNLKIQRADEELAQAVTEHDNIVNLANTELVELNGYINQAKTENIPIPAPADEKVDIQASDVIAE